MHLTLVMSPSAVVIYGNAIRKRVMDMQITSLSNVVVVISMNGFERWKLRIGDLIGSVEGEDDATTIIMSNERQVLSEVTTLPF